jgi:hypothetical protein
MDAAQIDERERRVRQSWACRRIGPVVSPGKAAIAAREKKAQRSALSG